VAPLIPITVIGGYLGAGKTTLLNGLLRAPGGRRLGVIVNDFGSIGIDAELLAAASDTGVVNLPNGCVCCTLGGDLLETLSTLRESEIPPDQIVIEASGVADPAVAAAWGTSAGFTPGGVIVLAAGNTIRGQLRDKYVGDEVRRQLAGADVVVITKTDICDQDDLASAERILAEVAPQALGSFRADRVDASFVFGFRPDDVPEQAPPALHRYQTWSWTGGAVPSAHLDSILRDLPNGIARLKGVVAVDAEYCVVVQVVGNDVSIEPADTSLRPTGMVALARVGVSLEPLTEALDAAAVQTPGWAAS